MTLSVSLCLPVFVSLFLSLSVSCSLSLSLSVSLFLSSEAKRRLKQEVHEISSLNAELESRLKGSKSEFILQEKALRERMMAKIQKVHTF